MSKTVTLRAQIDPKLKASAESVFRKLGIGTSEAIAIFFNSVRYNRDLPSEFKVPNRTTRKVMRDTDHGKNLIEYKDAEEMFKDLGI